MSTSTAPSATACAASAALTEEACAPDGKPTTVQTATVVCSGSRLGETQTENAPSSSASRHSVATCSSVASGLRRVWSTSCASEVRSMLSTLAGTGGAAAACQEGEHHDGGPPDR